MAQIAVWTTSYQSLARQIEDPFRSAAYYLGYAVMTDEAVNILSGKIDLAEKIIRRRV